mmetsp:Transcript_15206/g.17616  ORF Transcript_15206/g.17616 Transcript_15206/m.17616 type:complete len:291 (+) Transcript_15206:242-1114(+)
MVIGETGQEKIKKMTTKAGTLYFMSPEILSFNYSYKCDIWSLGVILYIMLCGYPPFSAETDDDTCQLILSQDFDFDDEAWNNVSDEAMQLISQILLPESKRISAKKILSHPWLKRFKNEEVKCDNMSNQLSRIRGFQKRCKFRKTILSYIAGRVSDEEVENEKKLFSQLDRNGDGYITKKEFREVNEKNELGYDVDKVFEDLDLDKNGAISYTEFIAATMNDTVAKNSNRLKQAFKFFDSDNDGIIGIEDFKNILNNDDNMSIGNTLIEEIIKDCDENGDGKIDYQEFYR